MLKSKIAPVIVGIILVIGAALWIWTCLSIDYSKMNPQGSYAKPAASAPAGAGN